MNLKNKKIIAREFLFFLLALATGAVSLLLIYPYNFYFSNKIKKANEKISLNLSISENLLRLYNKKSDNQHWFTREWENKIADSIYVEGGNPFLLWNDSIVKIDRGLSKNDTEKSYPGFRKEERPSNFHIKKKTHKNRFILDPFAFKPEYNRYVSIDHLVKNDNNKIWNRLYFLSQRDSINYKWNNVWSREIVDFIRGCGFNTPDQFKDFIEKNMVDSKDLDLTWNQANLIEQENVSLIASNNNLQAKLFDTDGQFKFGLMIFLIALFFLFVVRYFIYSIKWSIKIIRLNDE
jgi:hypothetical protein